ncbi:MAG: DinB family protein [Bryobacteraceae bacterium]
MISVALISKIDEQIERTVHLTRLVTAVQLSWRPPIPDAWSVGEVLGHLLDCMAGFCAVLYAAYPDGLQHFADLRQLPVNNSCGPDEANDRINLYRRHLDQGFALLTDSDLERRLPTVFVPDGETIMTLLLGNLEHLTNHKHQLFMYLRLMSVNVSSVDLYRLRGDSSQRAAE